MSEHARPSTRTTRHGGKRPPMPARGKLTDAEKKTIEDIAAKMSPVKPGPIAKALQRDVGTVHGHMMVNGMLDMRIKYNRRDCVRNGIRIYAWTREEDKRIVALRVDGTGMTEIARAITAEFGKPRKAHSVEVRLKMLAAYSGGPEDV